jgi:hypothetical protein
MELTEWVSLKAAAMRSNEVVGIVCLEHVNLKIYGDAPRRSQAEPDPGHPQGRTHLKSRCFGG